MKKRKNPLRAKSGPISDFPPRRSLNRIQKEVRFIGQTFDIKAVVLTYELM